MSTTLRRIITAGLLAAILVSAGVIAAKDRTNGKCRWEVWLSSDDDRTVRPPVTWAGFTQRVRFAGQRAWRAVWPEKQQAAKGTTAMNYTATGATIAAANGTYAPITGGWSNGAGYYLYYYTTQAVWAISTVIDSDPQMGNVPYTAPDNPTPPIGAWTALGAPPYSGTPPNGSPPTLAEVAATIRIGSSLANAALWDVATNHLFSKWNAVGGYRDVDADENANTCPEVPFQFEAPTGAYHALLKLDGHTWQSVAVVGDGTLKAGTFDEGLPFSDGVDSWQTWLGAAGAKALTVHLVRDSDSVEVATDNAAYTMFEPAVLVTTDPVTTVPDRFEVSLVWDEWYAPNDPMDVLLQAVLDGDTYDFPAGGDLRISTDGLTPVTTDEIDLAYTGAAPAPAAGAGLTPGAFILRATPYYGQDVGPPDIVDTALTHAETYTIQITAPTTGAALLAGSQVVNMYLAQGWWVESFVSLIAQTSSGGGGQSGTGFTNAHPNNRFLEGTVPVVVGDTSIVAKWFYMSGLDEIALDTDTIAITVPAGGGGGGGDSDWEGGGGPGPEPTTPWVLWYYPPSSATVDTLFTATLNYGQFAATVAGHLKIVAVGASNVTLYDADVIIFAAGGQFVLSLDFGAVADGAYTIYVTLTGVVGETALTSTALTLAAGGGGGDSTVPAVEIITPLNAATVAGTVAVQVQATDNVAVWRVAFAVDGTNTQYLYTPTSGVDLYDFVWDAAACTNGSHVLTATATDAQGNSATDTITVTVANAAADTELRIYTLQMGRNADHTVVSAESANWRDALYKRIIEVLNLPAAADLPLDPRYRYNVFLYYILDSASADLSLYSLWDPAETSHVIPPSRTIKWCIRFVPQVTTVDFDIAAASAIRFATASNGDPLLLCTTPHSIQRYSLTAGTVSEFADLSDILGSGIYSDGGDPYGYGTGYFWVDLATPTDIAAVGGKVYVAAEEWVYVYDEDTGDLIQRLQFWPDVIASVDALATDGTVLYIAATLDAGGSRLYRYTFDAPEAVCDHDESINFLEWRLAALYGGNVSGDLLLLSNDAWTVAHATGEDGLYALAANGAALYLGTGNAGEVYAKLSGWVGNWDSGFTAVSGLAVFRGFMYAGGTGTGARYLWYEATPGGWVQSLDTDDDVTAIADMMVVTDATGHEQLFVAAIFTDYYGGSGVRIYRIELAPASSMVCGTDKPNIDFKVLA